MLHKSQRKIYEPELSGTLHGFAYGGRRCFPPQSLDLTFITVNRAFIVIRTIEQFSISRKKETDKAPKHIKLKLFVQTRNFSTHPTKRISDVNYRGIKDENVRHFEVEIMGSNIKDNFEAVFPPFSVK